APPIATGPTPAAATRAANGTTPSRPTSAAAGTGSAANRVWAGKRPSTLCAMPGTASNAHCREMPTATDADPRDLDPRQPSETPLRRGFACPRMAATRRPHANPHVWPPANEEANAMALRAFGLNCTLKAAPEPSSTQKLLEQVLQALRRHDVESSHARVADFKVKAGVKADEGDGDQWPELRRQVMDA